MFYVGQLQFQFSPYRHGNATNVARLATHHPVPSHGSTGSHKQMRKIIFLLFFVKERQNKQISPAVYNSPIIQFNEKIYFFTSFVRERPMTSKTNHHREKCDFHSLVQTDISSCKTQKDKIVV